MPSSLSLSCVPRETSFAGMLIAAAHARRKVRSIHFLVFFSAKYSFVCYFKIGNRQSTFRYASAFLGGKVMKWNLLGAMPKRCPNFLKSARNKDAQNCY